MSLLLLFKGAGGGGTPQSTVFADLVVQLGLDAGPSTPLASTTWTDVSAYVRAVTTNRGRSVETDDINAGTCDLVLSNADRRFDPDYTSGPYYGKLLPVRRMRVLANYAGVSYPVFNGFTPDEWPQDYDGSNNDATVSLRCVDGFFVLNQRNINVSAWVQAVQANEGVLVALWWRLGETSGTRANDFSGNGYDGTYVNFPATLKSTAGLVAYDSDTAMQFDGTGYVFIDATLPPASGAYGVVEFWFSTTATSGVMFHWRATGDSASSQVAIIGGSVGVIGGDKTVATFNDGKPHHCVVSIAVGDQIWIDGVAQSVTAAGGTFGTTNIPGVTVGAAADGTNGFVGTLDEIVYYGLSYNNAAAATFAAGSTPYNGDSSGTRLGRILDAASWPTADRDVATGQSTLGPQTITGSSLGLAKIVEASEQGRFFISANGLATLQDRYVSIGGTSSKSTSTTSQATFSDQGGTDLPYYAQGFRLKKAPIRNTVTGQRDGGASITLSDSTSINGTATTPGFLERPWSVGGLVNSNDNDVRALLEHQLARYAQPVTICDSVTIKPQTGSNGSWTAAQLWAAVLGMEISKRYTLKRQPQGVGNTTSLNVLLEGVSHHITPLSWDCTPFFSAADARSDWFILGTSTLGTGVLAF